MGVKATSNLGGVPSDGAVVINGQSVPLQETDGTDIGNGTLSVTGHVATLFTYDGGGSGTALANGDPVNFDSTDGLTILATGTASVVDGNLVGVLAPSAVTAIHDQQNLDVNQYDNTAAFALSVTVSANVVTLNLANATTRVAVNEETVTISAGGQSVPATVTINQGAWQDFPLANATDTIVSDGDAGQVTVPVDGVNKVVTFTVTDGAIASLTTADP